jgi:hypothetical protein
VFSVLQRWNPFLDSKLPQDISEDLDKGEYHSPHYPNPWSMTSEWQKSQTFQRYVSAFVRAMAAAVAQLCGKEAAVDAVVTFGSPLRACLTLSDCGPVTPPKASPLKLAATKKILCLSQNAIALDTFRVCITVHPLRSLRGCFASGYYI